MHRKDAIDLLKMMLGFNKKTVMKDTLLYRYLHIVQMQR